MNKFNRKFNMDIETYCELDLTKVGVYKYVEHESFEVLMIAYAYGDNPVDIIDLKSDYDELILDMIEDTVYDPSWTKSAANANFERTALSKLFNRYTDPSQWVCSLVHAAELGLPRALGAVASALHLPEDKQKDKAGKALITFFCKPCKATKKNGGRTRNLPIHDIDRWNLFLDYCKQDVEAERAVSNILKRYPILESEQKLWELDQRINDRGIKLDRTLMEQAITLDATNTELITNRLKELTGLVNPNSVAQLKKWITENTSFDALSAGLTKDIVAKLLGETDDVKLKEVLALRQEAAKTSVSKYNAMERAITIYDRVHGLLQFFGARTGRWAGRLVQVQNLPQNKIEDLDTARYFSRIGDGESIDILYGNIPMIMSQLIRTAFIPTASDGLFYVADFSAIEAVVLAWIAGEQWRMDVFNTHGKIYEASASQMFKVEIDTIAKGKENYALRAKGKIAELALGYGGAKGALEAMGALDMGLSKEDLDPLVKTWRKSNKSIVDFWWAVGNTAINAVRDPNCIQACYGLEFLMENNILFIKLPSGRSIAYMEPSIELDRYNRAKLHFMGFDSVKYKWCKMDTYGPKLVENIVQAIARDCLAESMLNLDAAGYTIQMHVHDEIIIDCGATPKEYEGSILNDIIDIMTIRPEWAQTLPLRADGYTCSFYKKD